MYNALKLCFKAFIIMFRGDLMDKDQILEEKIKDILIRELQGTASEVKVQCRDGYVTLIGFVDTLSEKKLIEDLTDRVSGIKSIENCLTVSTDGTFSDKEAEAEIINKFRKHDELLGVSPKVHKGEAVLEGKVHTFKDKKFAITEASRAFGIKDVISHIEIDSVNTVDDVTINNSIQQSLINARLDDCDIRVDVENGNVWLSGYANSKFDSEIASEIIEEIEGVRNVKNFILERE